MPTLRGITVSVKVHDRPHELRQLHELGVQHFPRNRSISCYIQSDVNKRFEVSLKPQIPYPPEHYHDFTSPIGDQPGPSSQAMIVRGREPWDPPPFHLVASIYIDGQSMPERRAILYLDPLNPAFNFSQEGRTSLRARLIQGPCNKIHERGWYFTEVDLVTRFDQLLLSNDLFGLTSPEPVREDDLLEAMRSTSLTSEENPKPTPEKLVGQITIVLERVSVGPSRVQKFRPKHRAGVDEDFIINSTTDNAHTVELGEPEHVKRKMTVADFTLIDKQEGPYATFNFFYRSKAQLSRFNFPDFEILTLPKDSDENDTKPPALDLAKDGVERTLLALSPTRKRSASFVEQGTSDCRPEIQDGGQLTSASIGSIYHHPSSVFTFGSGSRSTTTTDDKSVSPDSTGTSASTVRKPEQRPLKLKAMKSLQGRPSTKKPRVSRGRSRLRLPPLLGDLEAASDSSLSACSPRNAKRPLLDRQPGPPAASDADDELENDGNMSTADDASSLRASSSRSSSHSLANQTDPRPSNLGKRSRSLDAADSRRYRKSPRKSSTEESQERSCSVDNMLVGASSGEKDAVMLEDGELGSDNMEQSEDEIAV